MKAAIIAGVLICTLTLGPHSGTQVILESGKTTVSVDKLEAAKRSPKGKYKFPWYPTPCPKCEDMPPSPQPRPCC